jgi:hypothetical protein
MKKLLLIAVLALATFVVPAAAKDHPGHGQSTKTQPAHARKCTPHKVAYVVSGTLVSGTLTKNDDGTYSGDLSVKVAKTNHHARADKGTTKSYTLDHAKAKLHGEDPAALVPGSRVRLQGKATELARHCDQTGFTSTTTIKRADIKPPKAAPAPAPTS